VHDNLGIFGFWFCREASLPRISGNRKTSRNDTTRHGEKVERSIRNEISLTFIVVECDIHLVESRETLPKDTCLCVLLTRSAADSHCYHERSLLLTEFDLTPNTANDGTLGPEAPSQIEG
jgi:hypothetical protein